MLNKRLSKLSSRHRVKGGVMSEPRDAANEPFEWHVPPDEIIRYLRPPYFEKPLSECRALDLGLHTVHTQMPIIVHAYAVVAPPTWPANWCAVYATFLLVLLLKLTAISV